MPVLPPESDTKTPWATLDFFLLYRHFLERSFILWLLSSHLRDKSHVLLYVTQMNKYISESNLEKMPQRW